MKQRLLEQLKTLISEMDLRSGDRLPSERQLALDLGVSRNSLRRILHMLEGKGLVEIEKGSGTFLKSRFFQPADLSVNKTEELPITFVVDQLEAVFHLFPTFTNLAVKHMDASRLDALQKRTVALSQSIMSGDPLQVWNDSLAFFRLIVVATDNGMLVNLFEELCAVDFLPFKTFFELEQVKREQIFGDHINLLNALRERNQAKAVQVTREFVVHLCQILEELKGVMPANVREYLKQEAP